MKKNHLFISIIILLSLLSIATAITVRASLVDDINFNEIKNEVDDYIVNYYKDKVYGMQYFNYDIDNFKKLKKESKFILKVKLSGNRKNLYGTVLSEIEVLKVYKGDSISKGDKVYIYEPSYIYGETYHSIEGYNLMLTNNEYIIYVNELKTPDGYRKTRIQEKSYMFTSLQFAKFSTNTNNINEVYNLLDFDNGDIKYRDIKHDEFIVTDKKELDIYNNIKKQSMLLD